jgi:LysM repeat protein
MSSRAPRRRRRGPATSRSAWVYIAPAALLGAVTAIMMILSSTGVLGHTADGGPSATPPPGPVQTLSVPDTTPPPQTTEPPPEPLPVTTAKATTASTAASTATTTTSASTTPSTTATTSATETTATTTGNGGQRVKWTVKTGDTLSSIATQFQTSVRELERLNPNVDPAALQVGQELFVR